MLFLIAVYKNKYLLTSFCSFCRNIINEFYFSVAIVVQDSGFLVLTIKPFCTTKIQNKVKTWEEKWIMISIFNYLRSALSIIWSKSFVRQDTRSLRVQCHFLKLRCPFFVSYYFVLHCEDTHRSKLIPKKCDEIIWMKIIV